MPKLTTDQRLTILESDVAVLKTDVVVLKQDVAILKQDVADIKVSLANLENKVDTLIVAFNDFAKKVDQRFDALESDVAELKTEVKVIHKKVDKLTDAVVELQEIHIKAGDKIEHKLEKSEKDEQENS